MAKITSLDDLPVVIHVKDLAEILSISLTSAYCLVRSGQVRTVRVGRRYLIPKQSLLVYLGK